MTRTRIAVAASVSFGLLAAAGCAPRLRAYPNEGQIAIEKQRGVIEMRGDLTASAVWVGPAPIAASREFTAFGVELQNRGEASVFIDPARMRLGRWEGNAWVDQAALQPDDLVRAYTPTASAGRFKELPGVELAAHFHRMPPPCPRPVYYYSRHDVWVTGSYNDGAMAAYRARQETASFLARLLRAQWAPKDHVAGGFVVFPQAIEKKTRYRVTVAAGVAVNPSETGTEATATQPVVVQDQVFEFFFEGR